MVVTEAYSLAVVKTWKIKIKAIISSEELPDMSSMRKGRRVKIQESKPTSVRSLEYYVKYSGVAQASLLYIYRSWFLLTFYMLKRKGFNIPDTPEVDLSNETVRNGSKVSQYRHSPETSGQFCEHISSPSLTTVFPYPLPINEPSPSAMFERLWCTSQEKQNPIYQKHVWFC